MTKVYQHSISSTMTHFRQQIFICFLMLFDFDLILGEKSPKHDENSIVGHPASNPFKLGSVQVLYKHFPPQKSGLTPKEAISIASAPPPKIFFQVDKNSDLLQKLSPTIF